VSRGRLEAFSDGVIAVVITIMVLELHPPDGSSVHDLRPLVPKLLIYLLSFVFIAIYWNNHHHLMHVVDHVSGSALWANAHLLFWLSLTPAAAAWLGPHLGDSAPAAVYGVVLLGSGVAYWILTRRLVVGHGPDSRIARAVGRDAKARLSVVAYAVGIAIAPAVPWVSLGVYVTVTLVWLIPDRRMERVLAGAEHDGEFP
jgi:TMEM175 potassium channel family protein